MTRRLFAAALTAAIVLSSAACAQTPTQRVAPAPAAVPAPQAAVPASAPPSPALAGLKYDVPFFPGATYNPAVPTGEALLGYPIGQKAATHAEIEKCFQAWANAAPDRARLVKYAETHEGRALYYMIITSPENMRRIDEIKAGLAKLADPRQGNAAELDRLAQSLPAVAWLAYTIHGEETSGSDAALGVAYHLTASTDAETKKLLEDLVVIIDPLENPDGRDRFLKMVREHRGDQPSVDDQALLHSGYWPWGRANHYLFDMNRDWIFATQPETRGRIAAIGEWHPLLVVDAHELESQGTFLFSPSREPVNPHFPPKRIAWWDTFAEGIAKSFDHFGWRYYTGEWNEGWYPGYTDAWASFRGAVGLLYEQARIAEDGVRRPEGSILTYRESVHHHLAATMASLKTLQDNRDALRKEFLEERRAAVAPDGKYAKRMYAIVPSVDGAVDSRDGGFIDLMRLQGFEVFQLRNEFTVDATDRLGRRVEDKKFPAGTILIPARQPEAALLAVMLDFDPHMDDEFLRRERRELLRFGRSKLYDVTAWNITMLHDLDAYTLEMEMPPGARTAFGGDTLKGEGLLSSQGQGFVCDGAEDASITAAARLMDHGVQVRVAAKPFRLDGKDFSRGSIVVTMCDNRSIAPDMHSLKKVIADACEGIPFARFVPIGSGLGVGNDAPDLGGENFVHLDPPRVALVSRGTTSFTSFGAAWWTLDKRLGMRITNIDADSLQGADLRRYNVIILPDADGGSSPGIKAADSLKDWVKAGGTLIAIGSSATALAQEKPGLSAVRLLPDVLEKLSDYQVEVLREWEGRTGEPSPESVWSATAPTEVKFPWDGAPEKTEPDELKRRDAWLKIFMPTGGAILAGRVDDRSWLTCGLRDYVPVLYNAPEVLMSSAGIETPVRLGVFSEAPKDAKVDSDTAGKDAKSGSKASADAKIKDDAKSDAKDDKGPDKEKDKKSAPRIGWSMLPEGQELRLRMSGLLWPEAAQRIANSAYVTREQVSAGQVILFACDPVFRGAEMGTGRMFINAVVLGPGMGTNQPIKP